MFPFHTKDGFRARYLNNSSSITFHACIYHVPLKTAPAHHHSKFCAQMYQILKINTWGFHSGIKGRQVRPSGSYQYHDLQIFHTLRFVIRQNWMYASKTNASAWDFQASFSVLAFCEFSSVFRISSYFSQENVLYFLFLTRNFWNFENFIIFWRNIDIP